MFDKLEDLIGRYEELMGLLNEPGVANDQKRYPISKNSIPPRIRYFAASLMISL